MTEDATKEKKIIAPSTAEDLSREIEQSAAREPDERIKAVRVFDNYYRCNWWVQDKTPQSFWLSTGTIRKSSLLRATKTTGGVLVTNVI